MSYYLLWIEMLLASLLFAAVLLTIGLRRKKRVVSIPLCALGLVLPLIPMVPVVGAAIVARPNLGLTSKGFWWAIALPICYAIGAIAMAVIARRRDAAGVRRAFSWPLARIEVAWLVVISLFAMTLWNLDLRAQIEIQSLRAEAGAIALSVAPPQIPDSANAAWLYQKAGEQFKATEAAADQEIDYRDLDVHSAQVKDYLRRQQKTVEFIRQAADMPQCRLNYDYGRPDLELVMPRLALFRAHANLLALAAHAEAVNGDPGAALADCTRLYAIGQHANSTPLLISGLVMMGVDALADNTIVRVLPNVTSKEQLAHFAVPDPSDLPHAFARSLRGDEAFGLARFCDMGTGQMLQDAAAMAYGKNNSAKPLTAIGGAAMWLIWLGDDVNIYREYLSRQREIAEKPFYQTAAERQQIQDELQPSKRRGVMSPIITPSVLRAMSSLANTQALRYAAAVAVAATRYRLDHGDYPASADALVPSYLETMPTDPFDGHPMRLKKLADGSLVIYSVGEDGKDDGGDVESKDDKHKPADVGLILKMPAAK